MAEELYLKEKALIKRLLGRSTLRLTVNWTEKQAVQQVITDTLSMQDSEQVHDSLVQVFKDTLKRYDRSYLDPKMVELVWKVVIRGSGIAAVPRQLVVVNIKTLREWFPEELGDWGGGGSKLKVNTNRDNPLSTTMRRR